MNRRATTTNWRGALPLALALCLWLSQGVFTMQDRRVVSAGGAVGGVASPAVVGGGLVFVSAISGISDEGQLVGPDVESQTRRALERLKSLLEASGSSLEQTLSVNVYLRSATDFDAMNAVYRTFFADKPPARTTVVTNFADETRVEIAAVAAPNGVARDVLQPAGWIKSPRPYSYIVRSGDMVFFAGLVSRRGSDDQVVPGPVSVQTKTILDNAGTLLRTAGLTFENVVASRVYLTDETSFEDMNDEYRRYFTSSPPARSTAITGLMGSEAMVEISFIASTAPKQVIGPVVAPNLPVSSAVRAGSRVFFSGVVGNTEANNGDVEAQAREVFSRIARTMESAGVTPAHVLESLVYLSDPWQRSKVDKVYAEFFPTAPPVRTLVGARLVQRAALVEVMLTATTK